MKSSLLEGWLYTFTLNPRSFISLTHLSREYSQPTNSSSMMTQTLWWTLSYLPRSVLPREVQIIQFVYLSPTSDVHIVVCVPCLDRQEEYQYLRGIPWLTRCLLNLFTLEGEQIRHDKHTSSTQSSCTGKAFLSMLLIILWCLKAPFTRSLM